MSYSLSAFKKNPILSGALTLTVAGFITRIIGFFYRIYLSRQIGAEQLGVYQLIFPVFGICFSLCCGPVQTAISRYVAAQSHMSKGRFSSEAVLRAGLILAFALACLCSAVIYVSSDWIAAYILMENRCGSLLRLMSVTIPICSLHCCISGYYYGLQKASIPAFAQLAEQILRVLSVYFICRHLVTAGKEPTVHTAVYGMICGEAASLIFSSAAYFLRVGRRSQISTVCSKETVPIHTNHNSDYFRKILLLAFPLAVTRLCTSLIQSAETVLIPGRLQLHGMNGSQALSVYGVLTGMAYPFILFPSAITGSVSVMLLPNMAKAQSGGQQAQIDRTTTKTIVFSLYLGILCTGLFLFYGDAMGERLFSSALAGNYITTLSWLCPFLYLSTTLGSILNGLGQTKRTFLHNILGLLSQLMFVLFLVPVIGIRGYLYGLLFGQLLITLLHLHEVRRLVHIHYRPIPHLLTPMAALGLAAFVSKKITEVLVTPMISDPVIQLCISGTLLVVLYLWLMILLLSDPKQTLG